MLKPEKARGESWTNIKGAVGYLPLFKEEELKKVREILQPLEGMDLENSFELLEKIKRYLLQAAQINSI